MTEPRTISVPEAGRRYYGLSRNGSYLAAKRGDIPTIKVGSLLKVPVEAMERQFPLWERDLTHREAEASGAGLEENQRQLNTVLDALRASTRRKSRQSQQSFIEATALFAAGCVSGALIVLLLIMERML